MKGKEVWWFECPFCDDIFCRRKKADLKPFVKHHLEEEQKNQEVMKFLDPKKYIFKGRLTRYE